MFLAGQEAPALAEPRAEMCVEIYDQTTPDISVELERQIGSFAVSGMEVHVQILNDAKAEGVLTDNDTERFADKLADICGWSNDSRVNVLLAYDHGTSSRADDDTLVVNIRDIGRADGLISEENKNRALDNLGLKLVDNQDFLTIGPDYEYFQEDIAELLGDLEHGIGATGSSASRNPSDSEPIRLPDIPWVPVGVGAGVLSLAGGVYARIRRNRFVDRSYFASLDESNAAGGRIFDAQEAAEPVATLAPDIGEELRQNIASGDLAIVNLKRQRNAFSDLYHKLRRSWARGSKNEIVKAAREIDTLTDSSNRLSQTIAAQKEAAENALSMIGNTVNGFQETLVSLISTAQAAEFEGWDLGRYASQIEELKQIETEILGLRDTHQIKRPTELVTANQARLQSLREKVEQLPMRRQRMLKFKEAIPTDHENYRRLSETVLARLARLRTDYDESCYESLAESEQVLQETVSRHAVLLERIAETNLPLSVDLLEDMERSAEFSRELAGIIQAESDKVEELNEKLSRLPGEIGQSIVDIVDDATALAAYTDHEDIDELTRTEISTMTQLINAEVAAINLDPNIRPKYFEIHARIRELRHNITTKRVEAQNQIRAAEESRQKQAEDARKAAAARQAEAESERRERSRRTSSGGSSTGRFGGGRSGSGSSNRRIGGGTRNSGGGGSSTRRFGGGRR